MHYDLADLYRYRPSIVHRLDPRVRVVGALYFILVVSLTPEGIWWAFGLLLALLLFATWLSHLGLWFTVRRSFVALPFVLAALAVPFTMPDPVLFKLPWLGWEVSQPGLVRFLSILSRSWLAVQAAILLTVTTRFSDLLWALGALHIPRPLISTIGFMYRYLFVLLDEGLRMIRARMARSARRPDSSKPGIIWQGRVTGAMVGSLFLRALERSERVYDAMLSRGYDGNMRSLMKPHMLARDWAGLAGAALLISAPLMVAWLR